MRFVEEYSVEAVLGQGAYGVVKSCKNRRTGKFFAVKTVKRDSTSIKNTEEEANMMQRLDNKNIIKFHGIYYDTCFVHIVMDRYVSGDLIGGLQELLDKRGGLKCEEAVHVMQQIGASIHYLHRHDIVHRDIKGDNYLLDGPSLIHPECRLVLTDFGAACFAKPDKRLHAQVGTKAYWAPEVYDRDYGQKNGHMGNGHPCVRSCGWVFPLQGRG